MIRDSFAVSKILIRGRYGNSIIYVGQKEAAKSKKWLQSTMMADIVESDIVFIYIPFWKTVYFVYHL